MHARRLATILSGAISTSIAACVGGGTTAESITATDGGTTSDTGTIDSTNPTDGSVPLDAGGPLERPFSCDPETSAYEALRVASGADYLEVRELGSVGAGVDAGPGTAKHTLGTKCGTATDKPACEAALGALSSDRLLIAYGGNGIASGAYLVFTKGNAVGKVSTTSELTAFTSTINSPAEAWVLARNAGYVVQCFNKDWVREDAEGFILLTSKNLSDCPVKTEEEILRVKRDGTVVVLEKRVNPETGACIGRRPAGLVAARGNTARTIGAYFARIARLEAASVDAFAILEAELAAHGAPSPLLRATQRARRDEIRHAHAMTSLARRYGATPEAAAVVRGPIRSLREMALENAVEGCVRETYGALEGMWQARTATDPVVRATMKTIARDEVRHGALSWQIADWLDEKLGASDKKRVREAREAEVHELRRRLAIAPAPNLVEIAGVPDAERASAFALHLGRELWAA